MTQVMRKEAACFPISSTLVRVCVPFPSSLSLDDGLGTTGPMLRRIILRISRFWHLDVLAPRSSRNMPAHGRLFPPRTSPFDKPPHCEEKQEAEAQDIGPERQIVRQDDGGHTVVPERLLYK